MTMKWRPSGWTSLAIAVLAIALLLCVRLPLTRAQSLPFEFWTEHALLKIRPGYPVPSKAEHGVALEAARNEFEPFQLVFRAAGLPVNGVDVEMSDLSGPGGATIPASESTVYLEHYINVKQPSSIEGATGDWPDALIPRVDRYAHEKRNAFPFNLEVGRTQAVWVDVYVPVNTPPGDYQGQARIAVQGRQVAAAPVKLRVWNFVLPSTSSLPNSFGFNGTIALKQHKGKYTSDEDLVRITVAYRKAALLHRISLHGGTMAPPRMEGKKIDWGMYDREMAPFLDGTVFSAKDPLPGARMTSAEFRLPSELPDAEQVLYYKAWLEHFQRRHWKVTLFNYLWDEPTKEVFAKVVHNGEVARRVPGVRNLITTSLNRELQPVTDIWTPLINCMERRPGFEDYCTVVGRDQYEVERRAGKSLWWYQSCASHGCAEVGGAYFKGWPSYMIDVPAASNRILQWLAWKYKIEGELYFNTDEAYLRKPNPWDDVLLFGGNGDGTLFYPGTPAIIGGSTDIPVESIRLKLIREGYEDYEYLKLCDEHGLSSVAAAAVSSLATNLYKWTENPDAFYAARRKMALALNGKIGPEGGSGLSVADNQAMKH